MCLRVPAGLKKSDMSFSLSESGDATLSNSDDSGSKSERMLGRGREDSMTESEQVNNWRMRASPEHEVESLFGPMYATFLLMGHTTVTSNHHDRFECNSGRNQELGTFFQTDQKQTAYSR